MASLWCGHLIKPNSTAQDMPLKGRRLHYLETFMRVKSQKEYVGKHCILRAISSISGKKAGSRLTRGKRYERKPSNRLNMILDMQPLVVARRYYISSINGKKALTRASLYIFSSVVCVGEACHFCCHMRAFTRRSKVQYADNLTVRDSSLAIHRAKHVGTHLPFAKEKTKAKSANRRQSHYFGPFLHERRGSEKKLFALRLCKSR